LDSSPSSHNGADWSIPSNIAPRVNKQVCIEKAVQQKMNNNFGSVVQMIKQDVKEENEKKNIEDQEQDHLEEKGVKRTASKADGDDIAVLTMNDYNQQCRDDDGMLPRSLI